MSIPEKNVLARDLVWRMFRDAADEDYLVARWSAAEGLHHQFFWSAQQALEKYMKAALLLNGENISNEGHQLETLYNRLSAIVGDLVPVILCPPNYFEGTNTSRRFPFELTSSFLSKIDRLGNPNVRYRQHSLTFRGYYLHLFDELSFLVRRVCVPLDMQYLRDGPSYRNVLTKNRRLQTKSKLSFQEHPSSKRSRRLLYYFKVRNFSYFEDAALRVGAIHSGMSATNSPIFMHVRRKGEGHEAVRWLIGAAKFRKDEVHTLRNFMSRVEGQNDLESE